MPPVLETKKPPVALRTEVKPGLTPWLMLAALAVVLVVVGVWFLVDYLTPTDTEATLRDYVASWESGDYAALAEHFALNGVLVNATTGRSFAPDEIQAEMIRLAGDANVAVTGFAVGASDRIATARFEISSATGDTLDGVSVWEMVGGEIRIQTVSYVTVYGSAG